MAHSNVLPKHKPRDRMNMKSNDKLSGTFPVLPTIYDKSGAVDEAGFKRVTEYAIAAGADGVVFPGLASEYNLLTPEERRRLTLLLGEIIDGRVKFIVGASADTPEQAIEYAKIGASAGADAAMIMTPHAYKDDLTGMVEFYTTVGSQAGLPIILQNAPIPLGVGLTTEDIVTIVQSTKQIEYVKEETPPTGHRISELNSLDDLGLIGIFGGAGGRNIIDEMRRGAIGTMPACEITEVHVALVSAYNDGDIKLAREIFEKTLPLLNSQIFHRWRLTKEVLYQKGLIDNTFVRAPGPSLDRIDKEEIEIMLQQLESFSTATMTLCVAQ